MATPDFCPARKRRSARPLGEVMLTTQAGTTVTQAIVFCGLFSPQEPTYAAGARHSQDFNGDSGLLPGAEAAVGSAIRRGHVDDAGRDNRNAGHRFLWPVLAPGTNIRRRGAS